MSEFRFRPLRCRPLRLALVGLALLAAPSWASRPASWSPSARELARGEADGVAVSSRGVLFPAPRLVRVGGDRLTGEPRQVWSATVDPAGNVYLGTGPDGRILRLTPSGAETLYYTVEEPMVTALAWSSDGRLLAGAAPGGRIYRIAQAGQGEVWSETGERYVWDLAVGSDGGVWAGTGERGVVLRLSGSGNAETFYDGEEAHVVALSVDREGRMLAGGAGQGLLVQIERGGRASVLLDSGLPEVVSMAREPDGAVVVALVGEAPQEVRPPAVRIQLPDGTQARVADESLKNVREDGTRPEIRGYIEGLPPPSAGTMRRVRGKIVRVRPDGRFTELWSSDEETPFCLLADSTGGILFGTGEPARLYRIDPSGDVALLASLREGQAARLFRAGARAFVATSNPAALYRLEGARPEAASFVSRPFDAGAPARWGALSWLVAPRPGAIELSTRSGNSSQPDASWSDWAVATGDPATSWVRSPGGRYLQWKLRFSGSGEETQVRDLTIHFEPLNRPPAVREFRLDSPERVVSDSASFRWEQLDPDGDPIRVGFDYRMAGSESWTEGVWEPSREDAGETGARSGWNEVRRTWSTETIPEGVYEVRARMTDAPGNPPGEAEELPVALPLVLSVDRTAPLVEIEDLGGGARRVRARDAHSAVRRVELVVDDEVRASLRSDDGVCDSGLETFSLPAVAVGEHALLRATDTAGNRAEAALRP